MYIKDMKNKRSPWAWIPTLYFLEGLPYVAVVVISVIMYKRMGVSNAEMSFFTSLISFPWVIKPLWSPFVDILKTKRWWTLSMQLLVVAGLALIALFLPLKFFWTATLIVFAFMAFASATHDIAADGFYMLALNKHDQSMFVGIRSTFYRAATIAGQGVLVILAGVLETHSGAVVKFWASMPWASWVNTSKGIAAEHGAGGGEVAAAWSTTFFILAAVFALVFVYHHWALPRPQSDKEQGASLKSAGDVLREFMTTFYTFFQKKHILSALLFMLLFRFPEAQLVKLINPFLLDPLEKGGLALSTEEIGLVYGIVGVAGLTLGGIIGGFCAAKGGLKKWLWPMSWAISLTCATFVFLSFTQTQNLILINLCVFIEQFGYGFGFTAYMLYLIYFSEGEHKTAHYAICTGFMALGMTIPGMFAGWLQEQMGYKLFFIWVMVCCVATIAVSAFVKIDEETVEEGLSPEKKTNNE